MNAVNRNIERSIAAYQRNDWEDAFKQIAHAIDGLAKLRKPKGGVGERIRKFVDSYENFFIRIAVPGLFGGSGTVKIQYGIGDKTYDFSQAFYSYIRNPTSHGDEFHEFVEFRTGNQIGTAGNKLTVTPGHLIAFILICVSCPENQNGNLPSDPSIKIEILKNSFTVRLNEYFGKHDELVKFLKLYE